MLPWGVPIFFFFFLLNNSSWSLSLLQKPSCHVSPLIPIWCNSRNNPSFRTFSTSTNATTTRCELPSLLEWHILSKTDDLCCVFLAGGTSCCEPEAPQRLQMDRRRQEPREPESSPRDRLIKPLSCGTKPSSLPPSSLPHTCLSLRRGVLCKLIIYDKSMV